MDRPVGVGKNAPWTTVSSVTEDWPSRALKAISLCNNVLVRATDEQELLVAVCDIIVHTAGYSFARVVYVPKGRKRNSNLELVASASRDAKELARARERWTGSLKRPMGAARDVARDNRIIVINDLAKSQRYREWCRAALARGFHGSIALPLNIDDREGKVGVLTIHAARSGAFDAAETGLLEDLAGDLAFGISTIRARAKRAEAERALGESEDRYRQLVDNMGEGLSIIDRDGVLTFVNPSSCAIFGRSADDIVGHTVTEFLPKGEQTKFRERLAMRNRGDTETYEAVLLRPDGEKRFVTITPHPLYDSDRNIVGSFAVVTDVTDRMLTTWRLGRHDAMMAAVAWTGRECLIQDHTDVLMREAMERYGRAAEAECVIAQRVGPGISELRQIGQSWWKRGRTGHKPLLPAGAPPHWSKRTEGGRTFRIEMRNAGKRDAAILKATGCTYAVVTPVWVGDKLWGYLYVGFKTPLPFPGIRDRPSRHNVQKMMAEVLGIGISRSLLNRTLARANLIVEASPNVLFTWRPEPGWPVAYVSGNVRQFGYTPEQLMAPDFRYEHIIAPEDRRRIADEVTRSLAEGKDRCEQTYRIVTADGEQRWLLDYTTVERDPDGQVIALNGVVLDTTERVDALNRVAESAQRVETIFNSVAVYIWEEDFSEVFVELQRLRARGITDLRGYLLARPERAEALAQKVRVREANDAALQLFGITDRKHLQENVDTLLPPESMGVFLDELEAIRRGETIFRAEIDLPSVGDRRMVGLLSMPVPQSVEDARRVPVSVMDITERKQMEERISYLARFDSLTGLVNRDTFQSRLRREIERMMRSGVSFAIHYLDLDNFKDVNDTLGHSFGDKLLTAVGTRLHDAVRATDTVARFGGDEFAILETDLHELTHAATLAEKILALFEQPFRIEGQELTIGTSIGVVSPSSSDTEAETLLVQADLALYQSKREGRGSYHFHSLDMDRQVHERMTLSQELRCAIDNNELLMHYQPQVEMPGGRIIGAEALIRWKHPSRGFLSPGVFVPVAEVTGMVGPMGSWALEAVCRQVAAWRAEGLEVPSISVNASGSQLKTGERFVTELRDVLAKYQLPPDAIELELTETVLMESAMRQQDMLDQIRALGVSIAIDDFGTGYSSLEYLQRYPATKLKVAQQFTQRMHSHPNSAVIVRATLGLAQDLGIRAIAEGVEIEGHVHALLDVGCREMQGFYFARPMAAAAMKRLLESGAVLPEKGKAGKKSQPSKRRITT